MNAGRVPRRRFLFFSLGSQGVQSVNPFEKNVFSQRKVHLRSDTFIFPAKLYEQPKKAGWFDVGNSLST